MSFSSDVKEELSRHITEEKHCEMAELAAIIQFAGGRGDAGALAIQTENVTLAKKCYTLIKKIYDVTAELKIRGQEHSGKSHQYEILVSDPKIVAAIEQAMGITEEFAGPVLGKLTSRECCKRAFIRGAFLASGSMSDPGKAYHLEIVCKNEIQASELMELMNLFQLSAKTTQRKNRYVVYIKESSRIVDILNIMGAHQSLMDLENVRIIKEMRNSANRQYNCDAANINKMVNAASRQLEDIRFIEENIGLENLNPALQEMAQIRLLHPEESLQELGGFLNPPVGKSGVNHRLRKLSAIAEELRDKKEA